MRVSLVFITLACSSSFLYGQEKVKMFYNEYGGATTQDSAAYYEEVQTGGIAHTKKGYYLPNNNSKSIEPIRNYKHHGEAEYYHSNGQLQYKLNRNNGVEFGEVEIFYPDGKIQTKRFYDSLNKRDLKNDNRLGYITIQYFDSAGRQTVINGNGKLIEYEKVKYGYKKEAGMIRNGLRDSIWTGFHPNGQLFYSEEWSSGKLVKGKSFWGDGLEYYYNILSSPAEPANGLQAFYSYVGKVMRYPRKARWKGIEGVVFLKFTVEKDGTISNVNVVKGIGSGCDEEAVRVLSSAPKWKPFEMRGRPVRSTFNLAIIFKLT
jgi:TonB family protein